MASLLLVDDCSIIREPLARVLGQAGHDCRVAATGEEALSMARSSRPELVLLDLGLPGMSGLEVLRALRGAHGAAMAVLVFSDRGSKQEVLAALELGVSAYILKDRFDLARFLAQVEQALVRGAPPKAAPEPAAAPSPAALPPTPEPPPLGRSAVELLQLLKPIMSRAEIQAKVDAFGELRAMSPTLAQVLQLSRSDRASVESMAQAIRCDHAIALKIIKLANSAVFTRGEPVSSVKTAVVRIGMKQIQQAVMNIGVVERFSSDRPDGYLDYPRFWEHAIATGIIAAELARGRGAEAAEAAFTMGLLHDVGRAVLAEQLGETYLRVLRTAREHRLPLEQVEKRMLLLTHADIMDRVLHAWQFPGNLINPIVFHQLSPAGIRSAAPSQAVEAATVALADRLAHAMLLGCSGNPTIYPTEDLCESLRVDGAAVERLEAMAGRETDDIKLAMLATSSSSAWRPLAPELRARLGAPVRPLFVSARPEVDAFRIVCDRLRDPAPGPPNLAVVHFRHARERAALTAALAAAEAAAGVSRLPLVAISLNGAARLEDAAMAGRASVLLAEPVVMDNLIDALRWAASAVGAAVAA